MTAVNDEQLLTDPMDFIEAGVYDCMPEDVYHADPVPAWLGGSLSSSGARKLLPPSCPALFAHEREFGRKPTAAFDLGHAAHRLVLGTGPTLEAFDAPDWRSKAAREFRDECRERGSVPLLGDELAQVKAMAAALRAHPVAAALFDPDHGRPEQSLFWQDTKEQPWRRARLDWLPEPKAGRMVVPDYKTARSAFPGAFGRAAADYGYAMQAAWYLDGVRVLGLADDAAFVFVTQEKEPPFLVTVVQLDAEALDVGRAMNRRALDIYAQCVSTGEWPGYSDDVELVSLPSWFVRMNEAVA